MGNTRNCLATAPAWWKSCECAHRWAIPRACALVCTHAPGRACRFAPTRARCSSHRCPTSSASCSRHHGRSRRRSEVWEASRTSRRQRGRIVDFAEAGIPRRPRASLQRACLRSAADHAPRNHTASLIRNCSPLPRGLPTIARLHQGIEVVSHLDSRWDGCDRKASMLLLAAALGKVFATDTGAHLDGRGSNRQGSRP